MIFGRDEGFLNGLKAVAKKVQGALPIVGLLSRLTAPAGGFDELVRVSLEVAILDLMNLLMRPHALSKSFLYVSSTYYIHS